MSLPLIVMDTRWLNWGDFAWVEIHNLAHTGRGVGKDAPSPGAWIINVLDKGLKTRQVFDCSNFKTGHSPALCNKLALKDRSSPGELEPSTIRNIRRPDVRALKRLVAHAPRPPRVGVLTTVGDEDVHALEQALEQALVLECCRVVQA